jgi:murein DD-endopeptidase MepM/ murein hydrolase activator NlpD
VSATLLPVSSRGPAAEPAAAERQAIVKAAAEFEALFLLQMLKQMRESVLGGETGEGGFGAAAMFDTIDSELARQLAGRVGLNAAVTAALAPPDARIAAGAPAAAGSAGATQTVPDRRVSSAFGWRTDPLDGTRRFHGGVDLRAAYGSDVRAAAAGRVVFAGERGGYGRLVEIEHAGGVRTRYAHLSEVAVRAGDRVGPGEPIGQAGRTGRATGVHVHFEVLQNGQRVEPIAALARLEAGFKPEGGLVDYPIGTRPRGEVTGGHDED